MLSHCFEENLNFTHGIEQIKIKIKSIQIHSNTLMHNLLVNIMLEQKIENWKDTL
jgi:hypothetical protein